MCKLLFCITTVMLVFANNVKAINEEQKADMHQKFLEFGAGCIKDNPLSLDDVNMFKSKMLPESQHASCFINCVFKAAGLIDDKGLLTHKTALDQAKEFFEDDEELKNIQEFLETCATVNDEKLDDEYQECGRAKLAFTCLAENSEKFGFNIDF